jgi:hypothetical protein
MASDFAVAQFGQVMTDSRITEISPVLQTRQEPIRLANERLLTMRTAAEIQGLPRTLHNDGHAGRLFAKARGTNDDVPDLYEISLRVGRKPLCASIAAEVVIHSSIRKMSGLFAADFQANKRAAACRTKDRFHLLYP